jgi:hypothetical protein
MEGAACVAEFTTLRGTRAETSAESERDAATATTARDDSVNEHKGGADGDPI